MAAPTHGIFQFIAQFGPKVVGLGSRVYGAVYDYAADYKLVKPREKKTEEEVVVTETEVATKKLGFFGAALDFLSSPTFGRILLLSAAIGMLFSPLGPVIGTIGLVATVGSVAYGATMDTKRLRNLRAIQEERALLEEISRLSKDMQEMIEQNPKLKDLVDALHKEKGLTPQHKASLLKSAGRSFATNAPENLVTLAAGVLTLNPVAFYFALSSTVLGMVGVGSQRHAYAKEKVELLNHNELIKSTLGLNFENGEGVEILRSFLAATRAQHFAITHAAQDIKSQPEMPKAVVKSRFLYHQELAPRKIKTPPERSFFKDMREGIINGLSWQKTGKDFAPMLDRYGKHYKTPEVMSESKKTAKSPPSSKSDDRAKTPHFVKDELAHRAESKSKGGKGATPAA